MKLLLLNDGIYSYASGDPKAEGGTERSQWLLGRALVRSGWQVSVGVRTALLPSETRYIDGVQFCGIGNGPIIGAWRRFFSTQKADWLFWQCADHMWGVAATLANLSGMGAIYFVGHDLDLQFRRSLHRRSRWWPLYVWGLAISRRIFVQHEAQRAALPSFMRRRAVILPGVVAQRDSVTLHHEREPYVAWTAVLREIKRPDLLVRIARHLPSIRFVVCGGRSTWRTPQNYWDNIVQQFRDQPNIEHLGHVSPSRAIDVISNASVFLCTSEGEGFPNTFLEAWAAATPVVSLQIDPDNLIQNRGLGILAASVENAAKAIATLMAAPETRGQIGARARSYVAETNTDQAVAGIFTAALR